MKKRVKTKSAIRKYYSIGALGMEHTNTTLV